MTSRDRTVAAALAITFNDRAARRHLVLQHPLDLERARFALDVADRRLRKRQAEVEADRQADADGAGPTAA